VTRPWQGIIGTKFSADGFAEYCGDLKLGEWKPEMIVVHNTGDPTLARWHDVDGTVRMRGLAGYYRDDQGWSAGPHLFVADDGIWVFTPLSVPGVHSPSWNAVSWGVELVGDYDHEPFGDAVKGNALAALATLHRLAGWTEATIKLHKDDPATTHTFCPGANVHRVELEAGIETLLSLDS
jgi:hypothetical protein